MSSDHENQNPISNSSVDANDYVKIVQNPDGTISRLFQFPSTSAAPDPTTNLSPVLTKDFCDLSSCFLMGTSAGGIISYHAGLRASSAVDELAPLKIRGLILHHPFFGGVRKTASEVRLANNPVLPLSGSDLMRELALPIGVDHEQEYCNPTADDKSCENFDWIRMVGWPVLVIGCDGDPLIDRQVESVETLKKKGVANLL